MSQRIKKNRGVSSITINEQWCKPCGICVTFCPKKVLGEDAQARPEVINLGKCNVCRLCELRCPEMAILVTGGDS